MLWTKSNLWFNDFGSSFFLLNILGRDHCIIMAKARLNTKNSTKRLRRSSWFYEILLAVGKIQQITTVSRPLGRTKHSFCKVIGHFTWYLKVNRSLFVSELQQGNKGVWIFLMFKLSSGNHWIYWQPFTL